MGIVRGGIIRDCTSRKGETVIGDKQSIELDEGIGLSRQLPIFFRQTVSMTTALPLPNLPVYSTIPATLVLHGKLSNCIGDIPPYDYHMLGGPFSVRGFNIGEIGVGCNFHDLATEIRYPLPLSNMQAYSYVEHASIIPSKM